MWIPLYLHRAQVVQKTAEACSSPPCGAKDRWGQAWGRWGAGPAGRVVMLPAPLPQALALNPCLTILCPHSLIFGAITCFTGFLGVVTGAGATRWCRLRTQRADPLVCAVGMLGSAIFICLIFVAAKTSIVGAYVSAARGPAWWGDQAPLGQEMQSPLWGPCHEGAQHAPALPRALGILQGCGPGMKPVDNARILCECDCQERREAFGAPCQQQPRVQGAAWGAHGGWSAP